MQFVTVIRFIMLACAGAIVLIFSSIYFAPGPSMIRDCGRINIGDNIEDVNSLLNRYLTLEDFDVNRGHSGVVPYDRSLYYDDFLGLYTWFVLDDLQCKVYFNGGKAVFVQIISD